MLQKNSKNLNVRGRMSLSFKKKQEVLKLLEETGDFKMVHSILKFFKSYIL